MWIVEGKPFLYLFVYRRVCIDRRGCSLLSEMPYGFPAVTCSHFKSFSSAFTKCEYERFYDALTSEL